MVGEPAPRWAIWITGGSCRCRSLAGFSRSVVCHRNRHCRRWRLPGAIILRNTLTNHESINLNGRLPLTSTEDYDLLVLGSGAGASIDEEKELHFASEKGAHFLLFDLN